MDIQQKVFLYFLMFILCERVSLQVEDVSISTSKVTDRFNFGLKVKDEGDFRTLASSFEGRKLSSRTSEKLSNETGERENQNAQKSFSRRYNQEKYYENSPSRHISRSDNFWYKSPIDNYSKRNESLRKIDHSLTWPAWSTTKKEIYNNRKRKNRIPSDLFEDHLGLDSKLHELSDRKYIHEHEGFFFPIHVPNSHHHEKDDHIIIPILLIILIPLLLFAIIIPLNANLLSTLFLIMQNNGATVSAAQIATGRKKKRSLHTLQHPVVEEKVVEMLEVIDNIIRMSETNEYY